MGGRQRLLCGGQVRAEPVRHFFFRQFAGGEGEHRRNRAGGLKSERMPPSTRLRTGVECEEQAGEHPGGPLVAVHERVVARHSERIGGGEGGRIVLAIAPAVPRPRQRGFQHAAVADAAAAAMLCELTIVDGERDLRVEPPGLGALGSSQWVGAVTWPARAGCRDPPA